MGDDVVQLYLKDMEASVKTPVKELKGFCRVSLKPDEIKMIEFSIPPFQLTLLNKDMKRVLEAGEFKVMIGKSSQYIALGGIFSVSANRKISMGDYALTKTVVTPE